MSPSKMPDVRCGDSTAWSDAPRTGTGAAILAGTGSLPRPGTLGPWEAGKAGDGTWYIHEAEALGFRPAWTPAGCIAALRPTPNAEADAKLITTAPELAYAVALLYRICEPDFNEDYPVNEVTEEYRLAFYAAREALIRSGWLR